MTRSLAGKVCVLCGGRNSTRDGEHVLPRWFLNRYLPISEGHYTTEVNGATVTNQNQQPRKHPWPEVRVPACEPCNTALRDRFEVGDSFAAVKKFFDSPPSLLTVDEADLAGLWVLKTWALLAHPGAVHSDGQSRSPWNLDLDVWTWTADGSAPPNTLAAWVTRQDIGAEASDRIDVPFAGEARSMGIYGHSISVLNGHLWEPVDQSFTDSSRCLWPSAGKTFNFGAMPVLPRSRFRWMQYPFRPADRLSVDASSDEVTDVG